MGRWIGLCFETPSSVTHGYFVIVVSAITKSPKVAPALIACALCWFAVEAAAEPPLYVGVLEDVEAVNLSPAMSSVHARVAFQKNGADWIPMKGTFGTPEALSQAASYFPATVNWTVR
jgi:hypothetical protein